MSSNEKPELRDRTLTFQMLWNVDRCMRRFLYDLIKHHRHTTPGDRMAQRVGRAFENARAAESPQEVTKAVEEIVMRFDAIEQPAVRERVIQLLERAAEIDEEIEDEEPECDSVVSEKQTQFYARLPNDWRMAAKPDEIRHLTGTEYGDMVQVIEEKTKGRYTSYVRELMYFFGMVVSLAMKQEIDLEDEKAWVQYRADLAAWEQRRRQSGRYTPRPPKPRRRPPTAIQLIPVLAGKVMNAAGELVPAPQPAPFMYSRRREQEKLAHAVRATEKIEAAFAANEFPPEPDDHCKGCPFRMDCPEGAAFLAGKLAMQADTVTPGVIHLPVIQPVAS